MKKTRSQFSSPSFYLFDRPSDLEREQKSGPQEFTARGDTPRDVDQLHTVTRPLGHQK